MTAENAERKQRGKPFAPGVSGNPSGKPKGTLNKTTVLTRNILQAEAGDVARVVLEAAKNGDLTAAKLVLDKLIPSSKESPIDVGALDLPSPVTPENAGQAMGIVLDAVASGSITPGQGVALAGLLEKAAKIDRPDLRVEIQSGQPCALDPALSASISHLLPHLPEPPKS